MERSLALTNDEADLLARFIDKHTDALTPHLSTLEDLMGRLEAFAQDGRDLQELASIGDAWVHDPSRDGSGCGWCGRFAQVDSDALCEPCHRDDSATN